MLKLLAVEKMAQSFLVSLKNRSKSWAFGYCMLTSRQASVPLYPHQLEAPQSNFQKSAQRVAGKKRI
jgi:hypothetical protein